MTATTDHGQEHPRAAQRQVARANADRRQDLVNALVAFFILGMAAVLVVLLIQVNNISTSFKSISTTGSPVTRQIRDISCLLATDPTAHSAAVVSAATYICSTGKVPPEK